MPDTERHIVTVAHALQRNEADPMRPSGYVVPYDRLTVNPAALMSAPQRMMREFFARGSVTVPADKVLLRADHLSMAGAVVGEMARHEDRDDGLWAEFELYDTGPGRDASVLISREAVTGLSIEIRRDDKFKYAEIRRGNEMVRRVDGGTMDGVGLVRKPAYADAQVAARSIEMSTGGSMPIQPHPTVLRYRRKMDQILKGDD